MGSILSKVAVEVSKDVVTTSTGIITQDKTRPDTGKVISKGKDVTDEVNIGDTVFFSEYAGKAVTVDGKELILLNQEEVYYVKD